jgi:hypothetical protein
MLVKETDLTILESPREDEDR